MLTSTVLLCSLFLVTPDGYVVVTNANGNYQSGASDFTVVDVTDPTNPSVHGTLVSSNLYIPAEVAMHSEGQYAYVAAGSAYSFTIVDYSDPQNPFVVSTIRDYYQMNFPYGVAGAWSGCAAFLCHSDNLTIVLRATAFCNL